MKKLFAILAVGALTLVSCKKDLECDCTTIFYTADGTYVGSNDDVSYKVSSQSECLTYNKTTTTEVTTCGLDD